MAGTNQTSGRQAPGGGVGQLPPRPGSKGATPGRPGGRPSSRPGPRASARQTAQRQRQRNIYMAMGGVGVVLVVVAALVGYSLSTGSSSKPGAAKHANGQVVGTFQLTSAILDRVEGMPEATLLREASACARTSACLDSSGGATPPQKLPASTKLLTSGGHPEVLYIGAEYCPYCAAERWPLLMALSKFGTFSGVEGTTSSSTDVNPSTPTFSFYDSSFASKYLTFVPVEEQTNTHATLQAPTAAQQTLFSDYDVPPYVSASEEGSIPFVYFAGKYVQIGAEYTATPLSGMGFQEAVNYMTSGKDLTSVDAEAVAGFLVGDLCSLTHDQPANVCAQVPSYLLGINTSSPVSHGSSVQPGSTKATAKKATAKKATATTVKKAAG